MLGKRLYLNFPISFMDLKRYSFVLAGELRQKIVESLGEPKSPTQLVNEIKTQDSSIARALRQLTEEKIVVCLFPDKKKGRIYELTKEGKLIREKLVKS